MSARRRLQGVALLAWLVAGVAPAARAADDKGVLLRPLAGAEVDWEAGTVTVEAGAAADLQMPGPDAARAAAQRQARAQATAILKDALRALPLGGGRKLSTAAAAAAAGRAKIANIDHQSNGGVILRLQVSFADLTEPVSGPAGAREESAAVPDAGVEAPSPTRAGKKADDDEAIAIAVASMPLSVAPEVVVDGKERTLGSAVYRLGEPPSGKAALAAKKDKTGRLLLKLPPGEAARLEGARAVIFVRSVSKR
ncbi:MAG TPA: hypothetical protein VGG33_05725 [Polyangia bacterium]